MGFGKSLKKMFKKAADPFLPESVKKPMTSMGGSSWVEMGMNGQASAAAPAAETQVDTGRLDQETMDDLAQKRLARLGKYFTSPIGVLSNANTASSKVFS